jgi:hypothetical protein
MTSLDDLADDRRLLLDVAPDQEESCVHVVLRRDSSRRRVCGSLGPVVVGERQLPVHGANRRRYGRTTARWEPSTDIRGSQRSGGGNSGEQRFEHRTNCNALGN